MAEVYPNDYKEFMAILLFAIWFAIWIVVTPIPVGGLLSRVQLDESLLLVVIGLVALIRAVFIAVPGVIVLVALVIVALVVLALLFFVVLVVLRAGSGHHRDRRGKGGSQKKCTEISESTVHVVLL